MEKTINIGGRAITLKSTGGTLMRYRNQFNAEFLTDFAAFTGAAENPKEFTTKSIEQIIWALAKTADDRIPDPQAWYDSFDSFDIWDAWEQAADLVGETLEPLINRAKNVQTAAES